MELQHVVISISYADIIICELKIVYGEETIDSSAKTFLKKLKNCTDVT